MGLHDDSVNETLQKLFHEIGKMNSTNEHLLALLADSKDDRRQLHSRIGAIEQNSIKLTTVVDSLAERQRGLWDSIDAKSIVINDMMLRLIRLEQLPVHTLEEQKALSHLVEEDQEKQGSRIFRSNHIVETMTNIAINLLVLIPANIIAWGFIIPHLHR